MYLERSLPDVPPKVDLDMEFKPNVDPMTKQDEFRAKFGFPTQTSEHGLTVVAQMNVDLIEKISRPRHRTHVRQCNPSIILVTLFLIFVKAKSNNIF